MQFILTILLGFFMLIQSTIASHKNIEKMLLNTKLTVQLNPSDLPPFDKQSSVVNLYTTITPILGQLLYSSNSYDLQPGLLESFKWDYKSRAYILKIKKGLVFHNGRNATAKDLEFSLLRGFYSKKPSFLSFFENIEGVDQIKGDKIFISGKVRGIKIIDPQTLSVKLNKPNPSFLHSLARSYFSLVPIEEFANDYETWKNFPIGTGNYKVKLLNKKNKTLTLEKVNQKLLSAQTILINYGTNSTQNDINIATLDNEKEIFLSKRAASLTSIYFNYNNPISSNINFRRAINLALKRSELIKNSQGLKPTNEFLAEHFWGRLQNKETTDIEKSKSLLKKIPHLDLNKIYEIPIFNKSIKKNDLSYDQVLEKQLQKIGLKVKFIRSTVKFFPKNNHSTLFRILSLGADVADPLVLFGLLKGQKSPLSPHFPSNDKKYGNLFDKAQKAISMDQRVLSIKELSQYVNKNVWMVPLFERKLLVSFDSNKIKSIGKQDGGLTFFLERTILQ